jgi:transposase-like protein
MHKCTQTQGTNPPSAQKGLVQVNRDYGIKDTILSRWTQEFLERALHLFSGEQVDNHKADQRIAELERMVGKLTLELDLAKKPWTTLTGSERQMEQSHP